MYVIETAGFQPDDIVKNGNQFTVANGVFGYRGTLEEYRAEDLVQLTMGGVYDRRRDGFEEAVAFFNPLYTYLRINGETLHPRRFPPEKHVQTLDMENGLHVRRTVFQVEGADVSVTAERFLPAQAPSAILLRYRFSVNRDVDLELFTGTDTKVADGRGPHLDYPRFLSEDDIHTAMAPLLDGRGFVSVSETATLSAEYEYDTVMIEAMPLRRYRFRAEANRTYTLLKVAAVAYGVQDPSTTTVAAVTAFRSASFDEALLKSAELWRRRWDRADVLTPDNPKQQAAIRSSIWTLLANRPSTPLSSVPMRGLGCQGMQGAVSWDTELCLLSFYLNTDPEAARNLLLYRFRTLPGARAKAASIGCKGAFFAMQSLSDGSEAVVSESESLSAADRERIARTSIYTSGVVAYALMAYYARVRDDEIMVNGGLSLLLECAHFYATRFTAEPERRRLSAKGVTGPDEYHAEVDDDALTIRLAVFTMESAIEVLKAIKLENAPFVKKLFEANGYAEAVDAIKAALPAMPSVKVGSDFLIEQYPGYHALEDASIKDVKKRMSHPSEYLGGPKGVATSTKIIRQADVVMLLSLFESEFSRMVKNVNLQYYEPRTERGTPLSGAFHAILAAALGKAESAVHYLQKSVSANTTFEGRQFVDNLFVGGTYPLAAGAAYLSLTAGFCGLRAKDGYLMCDARLPDSIKEISFRVSQFANVANVVVKNTGGRITWERNA
ncbi:MAG: hypothetical protein WC509_00650 [Candidatus Izemoplasmatales bacterium]